MNTTTPISIDYATRLVREAIVRYQTLQGGIHRLQDPADERRGQFPKSAPDPAEGLDTLPKIATYLELLATEIEAAQKEYDSLLNNDALPASKKILEAAEKIGIKLQTQRSAT